MADLVILTGASRGLGLAMAEQFLQRPDTFVLGLSRKPSDALMQIACAAGSTFEQWAQDLADTRAAAAKLQEWLLSRDAAQFMNAILINNAALLTPPGPVEACGDTLLSEAVRVGLESPVLLCAAFLRGTVKWRARKKILNISSGLGRRAMAGSAPYCAVKAGLDNFSRALALDEALKPNGAKVVSLAHGVIDTNMQLQLRSANAGAFPDKAMFVGLKASGQLASPRDGAARVIAYLDRPDFGSHPVGDVRDA